MSELLTDSHGRTWHALEREGGSISLYYTRAGSAAHYVVWDSLDAPKRARQSGAWDIVRAAVALVCDETWPQHTSVEAHRLEATLTDAGFIQPARPVSE
jgi:hypothetical protein